MLTKAGKMRTNTKAIIFGIAFKENVPDIRNSEGRLFRQVYYLIDKRSLEVKRIVPSEGKRATHTELSGDGRYAYISVYERDGSLVIYDGVSLKRLKEYPADMPAGKYNFINKSRSFDSAQLGYQVFMEKCWGCHHTTRQAFGPPLKWSAQNRDKALIMAQILDPANTYGLLGYGRNAMPSINLKEEELKALLNFMEVLRDEWTDQ
ncbi:MAG: cytochrome D1 domain-containing protein [Aquificaceae bacterium]